MNEDLANEKLWSDVDHYLTHLVVQPDPALATALAASDAEGLPMIAVSAPQGKMLHLFARMLGAKHILEIGTLGGYSAIWMARGLAPGGKMVTLEADEGHALVARGNLARAGLADRVEVVIGKAIDTLPVIDQKRTEPFDLVFIDADKASIPAYFERSLAMTRRGGLIVVDNVIREGHVLEADYDDAVRGVRDFNDLVAREPRVTATTIQTVGAKGYDGFAMVLVTGETSG